MSSLSSTRLIERASSLPVRRVFRAMLRTFPPPKGTLMTDHAEHHHALSYADAIRQFRADKDAYFRTGHASPVPTGERTAFTGDPVLPGR